MIPKTLDPNTFLSTFCLTSSALPVKVLELRCQKDFIHKEYTLPPVYLFNPIQDGPFWGLFPKTYHISFNDETWHSYTLPKKDPKNI